ncbi:tagatose 1,6-diphosphate aldolase, partial [Enterococcus canintestini]
MTTEAKKAYIKQLSDKNGVISALAIDQRGALKKMINKYQDQEAQGEQIEEFKKIVSSELTQYASSILLDPEYGLPAAKVRDENAGLLLAYEKTGYDASTPGRLPDILSIWSVKRLKEAGADACKFLLYYDVDESDEINDQKKAFMERIGSECAAEDL